MRFKDFIIPGGILEDLTNTTKSGVIAEILDAMIQRGGIPAEMRTNILNKLIEREAIGTTGIGSQIAVPHARHPGIKNLVGFFARSRDGVDFDAIDGEPVHIFIMLLSNQDSIVQHLESLNFLSQALGSENSDYRHAVINAKSVDDISSILDEIDNSIA